MLQEARRRGIQKIKLYVYPPFLADLLLPFAWLPVSWALWIWRLLSLLIVALSAYLIGRLLRVRWPTWPAMLVLAGIICFSPLWQGLHYGQITVLLFGLWCGGVFAYDKKYKRISGGLFGIAVLIKLTPLLVIFPFLIWRDWRWTRWFLGTVLVGFLLTCVVNSPQLLATFFLHVVPPMSKGIASRENQTILSAVQMIWSHGRNYSNLVVPRNILKLGKMLSAGLVAVAVVLTYRLGADLRLERRPLVLAAFALLSPLVSPVAWIDTLVLGYLLLAVLWASLLRQHQSLAEVLLLTSCSIGMGASLAIKDLPWIRSVTALQYIPLLSSIVLVIYALYKGKSLTPAVFRRDLAGAGRHLSHVSGGELPLSTRDDRWCSIEDRGTQLLQLS